MKTATLPQIRRMIELFENTPMEQVQAVLGSGLLTDVRDAEMSSFNEVNRNQIREILGLRIIVPAVSILTFSIDIDFDTLEKGIALGKYDDVDPDITSEYFRMEKGNHHSKQVHVVHFNRALHLIEVNRELNERNFRSATFLDLLGVGKDYPDLQKDFIIFALNSERWIRGDRKVPSLDKCELGRRICLREIGGPLNFSKKCRFLVVDKLPTSVL